MLLTITSTADRADDLGYLLYKHPAKVQRFELPVGTAFVFYPEVADQRCTVALVLEVDPIGLVRGRKAGADSFALQQYVNDRPYAASSMLAVALGRVFNTAMSGRCDSRPELAAGVLPLTVHLPALPCRGGPALAEQLFAPLGWTVTAAPIAADPQVPHWGWSRYVDLHLAGDVRLADALHHLYVLLPVLDDAKHYWVGVDEVDKLVRAGAGWLAGHPHRDLITHRYLAHQRPLVTSAIDRLAEVDDTDPEQLDNAVPPDEPPATDDERPPSAPLAAPTQSLAALRRDAVLTALRSVGATSVVDMGCGEGALLRALLADSSFTRILGVDVSHRALQVATRRLQLADLPDRARQRIDLQQSSLTYRDDRLRGFDAMVLMEVIEHLYPSRLDALQRNVFAQARPGCVVITTPNVEVNVRYPGVPAGGFRHPDHRFEWTRAEFQAWVDRAAAEHGYTVTYSGIGPVVDDLDDNLGAPTQLALCLRTEAWTGPAG